MAELWSETQLKIEVPRAAARGLFHARSAKLLVGVFSRVTSGSSRPFCCDATLAEQLPHPLVPQAPPCLPFTSRRTRRPRDNAATATATSATTTCQSRSPIAHQNSLAVSRPLNNGRHQQRQTPSSHKHHPDLIRDERTNVGQHSHIDECKHRPSPTVGLAANHH